MRQPQPLEFEESYGVEAGTPTLTLVLKGGERMIPYHSFCVGSFHGTLIELTFQEWSVSIGGHHLDPLWKAFQLQDVRWVRTIASTGADHSDGECAVTSIGVEAVES